MLKDPGKILILGAGPTGLGAAYRLRELGFEDFCVLEAERGPGGLASSYRDDMGFTWDLGGHVQFSHYAYYDDILDLALAGSWLWHERESWISFKGRFIPYPFQHHIHWLDPEDREWALRGLERAAAADGGREPPANFAEWIRWTFGEGLGELFLCPYNHKVWGYPLERMGVNWIGERVAVPNIERVKWSIRENRDDVSWGPNSRFRFPQRGGTGRIWQNVAQRVGRDYLRFEKKAIQVDLEARTLRSEDGRRQAWDTLITTIPLDVFSRISGPLSFHARRAGLSMVYSSVHILGFGLKGGKPESLENKCWIYFPESDSPYYRVTVFSNYSPYNVPEGDQYWSLMAEVCESPHKPVDTTGLRDWALKAMKIDQLIESEAEIVSFWHKRLGHGYPTPFLGRDEALGSVLPELERRRVYSRGRFGGWKYEVSNQDHSFMQGVELVNHLLKGEPETTFPHPTIANSGVFLRQDDTEPKME